MNISASRKWGIYKYQHHDYPQIFVGLTTNILFCILMAPTHQYHQQNVEAVLVLIPTMAYRSIFVSILYSQLEIVDRSSINPPKLKKLFLLFLFYHYKANSCMVCSYSCLGSPRKDIELESVHKMLQSLAVAGAVTT